MNMLRRFIENHVLANLTFALVLGVGTASYVMLPREQDPTINFNWIQITTFLPGASAEDVEKRVTDPLEEVLRKVPDIRFVSSYSRESMSSILVRFNEIDERTFDKRLADLRREIQNKQDELPEDAEDSEILEITSSSGFPAASIVITGPAADENLRRQGQLQRKKLERLKGVDRVDTVGLLEPELQVLFHPSRLSTLGVDPSDLADTVRAYFRDTPAGTRKVGADEWLIRLTGTNADPQWLASMPIVTANGEVTLGDVAEVRRGREKASAMVMYEGRPAILLSVIKKGEVNTLKLVERLNAYVDKENELSDQLGVRLVLTDDQTEITRNALNIMQSNAALGLVLVLLVSWAFLGFRIAFLVSIGIPFVLMGTFWILRVMGHTLNVMVLLGVVIVLGMLVDDAVVVVENIHHRINRGKDRWTAVIEALREIVPPVTTSVLTTMAAFLPLLLMPGIMGKFMGVVPMVVSIALALSLVEAYWMLPAHLLAFKKAERNTRAFEIRRLVNHKIRITYTRLLIKIMRYPVLAMFGVLALCGLAGFMVANGNVKRDFFASDTLRIFYIKVQMPAGTPLERTLEKTLEVEEVVRGHLQDDEVRSIVSFSGQMFTEVEPLFGDRYGQVQISLKPKEGAMREVNVVIDGMRADLDQVGGADVSVLKLEGGPPTTSPISVKVRGDSFDDINAAVLELKQIVTNIPGASDVSDDAAEGRPELSLTPNMGALQETGIMPDRLSRNLALLVDGERVAALQHQGEEVEVRVKSFQQTTENIDSLLDQTVITPAGGTIPIRELVDVEKRRGMGNVRHYNFRRTVSVESDLDSTITDTVTANQIIADEWTKIAAKHPNIDLDFSGELEDIKESLDAMLQLFLFGLGLIYLIIGTQFRSYFQPFLIIMTVPMAFTGVVFGLLLTNHPMSLYTLYGVVALAGIAVNAAIVLISATNQRLDAGMSVNHAVIYAARRRVIPILITTLTTIAGLSSLALGLGGKSLIWGPVAIAIVWGLAFSSTLTLFAIPVMYRIFGNIGRKKTVIIRPN